MSLLDAFTTPPLSRRGPECAVGILLARVGDDERALLATVLDKHSGWLGTEIARRLTDNGHPIKADVIQRHRRSACECPR